MGIAGNGWELLEMDGNCWYWMRIAGNGWEYPKDTTITATATTTFIPTTINTTKKKEKVIILQLLLQLLSLQFILIFIKHLLQISLLEQQCSSLELLVSVPHCTHHLEVHHILVCKYLSQPTSVRNHHSCQPESKAHTIMDS